MIGDNLMDTRDNPVASEVSVHESGLIELRSRLSAVKSRISEACLQSGRDHNTVKLVTVTKFHPLSTIRMLMELGLRDFGENREQEARAKSEHLLSDPSEGISSAEVRWHMLGTVQRKKANTVARWAHTVQSVDSSRLALVLGRGVSLAKDAGLRAAGVEGDLMSLVQVSLDGDPSRGGVPVDQLMAVADTVAQTPGLRLGGLMMVAPLGMEPDRAFADLACIREGFLRVYPDAQELSSGMSGDFESAILHGSTCVRVGTAIVGPRPLNPGLPSMYPVSGG